MECKVQVAAMAGKIVDSRFNRYIVECKGTPRPCLAQNTYSDLIDTLWNVKVYTVGGGDGDGMGI